MTDLTVSVVVHEPQAAQLHALLDSLIRACYVAEQAGLLDQVEIWLVDNGETPDTGPALEAIHRHYRSDLEGASCIRLSLESGHGNVGYGRGNNRIIRRTHHSGYFLVSNPDVELASDALVRGIEFLDAHPDVALVAPAVLEPDGSLGHLCKRYPTVFDLFLRGFAPRFPRKIFQRRLDRYALTDLDAAQGATQVPIASGSFMLCKAAALRSIGGFDPGYFLYFEDFDLSLRMATEGPVFWLPAMRIRHGGGQAARKGARHQWLFVRSALRFFSQRGWRWR